MNDDDKPLPEDAAIAAAHPLETQEHLIYAEALRMVSAKYSKGALVELVNWLLYRLSWRKPGTWPQDASEFVIKMRDNGWRGHKFYIAHWARGGGEDQPCFGPGIFYYNGSGYSEIDEAKVIGWKPLEATT